MKLLQEIRVIAADEIVRSFRTKKVFYMLIVFLLFLLIAKWTKVLQLGLLVLFNPEKILPLPLLVPHLLFYFVVPILSVLYGFDIISGEFQSHTIRFLASHFSRKSIIIGKFLGSLAVLSFTVLVVLFASTVYSAFVAGSFLLYYPFLLWLFLTAYAAAFLSLVCLVSALTSRSSATLYLVFLLFTILSILPLVKVWPALSPFTFFRYSLSLATVGLGMLRLLAYASLFMFISTMLFERRNIL